MPSTDVVELLLEDHRRMEELFRTMRNVEADRAAALEGFADLLIAHASAEEDEVYPALRRYKDVEGEDVDHSVHEHHEAFRRVGGEARRAAHDGQPPRGRGGTHTPQRCQGERRR